MCACPRHIFGTLTMLLLIATYFFGAFERLSSNCESFLLSVFIRNSPEESLRHNRFLASRRLLSFFADRSEAKRFYYYRKCKQRIREVIIASDVGFAAHNHA